MQQPPVGAAVARTFSDFEEDAKSVLNIVSPAHKNKNVADTARCLILLYRNTNGGLDGFAHIYKTIALKLTGDQRRELHRLFREKML